MATAVSAGNLRKGDVLDFTQDAKGDVLYHVTGNCKAMKLKYRIHHELQSAVDYEDSPGIMGLRDILIGAECDKFNREVISRWDELDCQKKRTKKPSKKRGSMRILSARRNQRPTRSAREIQCNSSKRTCTNSLPQKNARQVSFDPVATTVSTKFATTWTNSFLQPGAMPKPSLMPPHTAIMTMPGSITKLDKWRLKRKPWRLEKGPSTTKVRCFRKTRKGNSRLFGKIGNSWKCKCSKRRRRSEFSETPWNTFRRPCRPWTKSNRRNPYLYKNSLMR